MTRPVGVVVSIASLRNHKPGKQVLVFGGERQRQEPTGAQNLRALDTYYDTIRTAMRGLFQELGLAA